jgi:hypothetical protein
MFNKVTPAFNAKNALCLVFLNSAQVLAFPCGRRRTPTIDANYSIPFDPEARLNTEANNRKHSGLNGYTQTFMSWESGAESFIVVIDGYLFEVKLPDRTATASTVGDLVISAIAKYNVTKAPESEKFTDAEIEAKIEVEKNTLLTAIDANGSNEISNIYANILIQKVPLYSSDKLTYQTSILRDQAADTNSNDWTSINPFIDLQTKEDPGIEDYYFAGLSFSVKPLAEEIDTDIKEKTDFTYEARIEPDGTLYQKVISCKLFEREQTDWKLCNQMLLPKIEHGETEGSVKMKTVLVDNLKMPYTDSENKTTIRSVPSLNVVETSKDSGIYQLQFAFGKEEEKEEEN